MKQKITKDKLEIWIEDILMKSYPNYPWYAELNTHTGQISVWNLAISGSYGFSLNMYKSRTWSELKKLVLNYGGELLERASLPRMATEQFVEEYLAAAERELNNSMTIVGLDTTK